LSCKGAGQLTGRALAILEALLRLRDSQAQELDRPPFKVISAETLLEAAEKRPRTLGELATVKGMTPGQLHRHGDRILAAITAALAVPERDLPRFPRQRRDEPGEGSKERLKRLKSWRQEKSGLLGLEPGVIAPNWLLEAIAEANPASGEDFGRIANMREWQKGAFGGDLLAELAAV
jgi:ribonuclease D